MIDIDGLSEAELRDLNHRIVARLRLLRDVKAHEAMLAFRVGDRVSFESTSGTVTGVITRYNRKTVGLMADSGHQWNVSPNYLRKAGPPARNGSGPVIDGELVRPAD